MQNKDSVSRKDGLICEKYICREVRNDCSLPQKPTKKIYPQRVISCIQCKCNVSCKWYGKSRSSSKIFNVVLLLTPVISAIERVPLLGFSSNSLRTRSAISETRACLEQTASGLLTRNEPLSHSCRCKYKKCLWSGIFLLGNISQHNLNASLPLQFAASCIRCIYVFSDCKLLHDAKLFSSWKNTVEAHVTLLSFNALVV